MSAVTEPPVDRTSSSSSSSSSRVCACRVETWHLTDDGIVPNNARLAVVCYRGALDAGTQAPASLAARIEARLQCHGWLPDWRGGVYGFRHYHSTAHEVLVVWRGRARLELGGQHGVEIDVEPGDGLVLPAGVGHRSVAARNDFSVVGAYPEGQSWDLCRDRASERRAAIERIRHVALPRRDPLFGGEGPLVELWGL